MANQLPDIPKGAAKSILYKAINGWIYMRQYFQLAETLYEEDKVPFRKGGAKCDKYFCNVGWVCMRDYFQAAEDLQDVEAQLVVLKEKGDEQAEHEYNCAKQRALVYEDAMKMALAALNEIGSVLVHCDEDVAYICHVMRAGYTGDVVLHNPLSEEDVKTLERFGARLRKLVEQTEEILSGDSDNKWKQQVKRTREDGKGVTIQDLENEEDSQGKSKKKKCEEAGVGEVNTNVQNEEEEAAVGSQEGS